VLFRSVNKGVESNEKDNRSDRYGRFIRLWLFAFPSSGQQQHRRQL